MNSFARFSLWTVEKHVDARRVSINETDGFERCRDTWKIGPVDQQINIGSISHGSGIDSCDPSGNSVSAHHSVRDACNFKSTRCAAKTFSNLLHGKYHPF